MLTVPDMAQAKRVEKPGWRKIKSIRLLPETITHIQRASSATGLSEGEIVEACVTEPLPKLLKPEAARRAKETDSLTKSL